MSRTKMLLTKLQEMFKNDPDYMADEAYSGIKDMTLEEFETYETECWEDDFSFQGSFEEYIEMIIEDFGGF